MVWHVHYKKGKFNIWSTIIDSYILTNWVTKDVIIQAYVEQSIKEAKDTAIINLLNAEEYGCSATRLFRCEKEEL